MLVNFTVRSGVGEKWTLHEMLTILKGANDVDSALKERNSSFADMFVGAIYGQWEMDAGRFTPAAKLKSNYMTTNMSTWIGVVSP